MRCVPRDSGAERGAPHAKYTRRPRSASASTWPPHGAARRGHRAGCLWLPARDGGRSVPHRQGRPRGRRDCRAMGVRRLPNPCWHSRPMERRWHTRAGAHRGFPCALAPGVVPGRLTGHERITWDAHHQRWASARGCRASSEAAEETLSQASAAFSSLYRVQINYYTALQWVTPWRKSHLVGAWNGAHTAPSRRPRACGWSTA